MRGYRDLRQAGQHKLIRELHGDLANSPVWSSNRCLSQLIYGAGAAQAELITRQYLLARIGGIRLNHALLYSHGRREKPVIHPLPRVWQNVLVKHGFPVARTRCSIAWSGYVCVLWAYGVLAGIRIILRASREIARRAHHVPRRYAYFDNLSAANLPQPCKDGRSYDVVTWYSNWKGRSTPLDLLCHGVRGARPSVAGTTPVVYAEDATPALSTIVDMLRFTGWWLMAASRSAFDAVRGNWWHALLLSQSALAARVRLSNAHGLARDYLFHNSGHVYRPLWTYEAEKKGSRVIMYFYSTSEQFRSPEGYVPDRYEWGAMNWPIYLVWDKYQEDVIKRALGNDANTQIVGPIWFQTSAVELPEIPNKSVAVFDVQPYRSSSYFGFSTLAELYGGRNVENRFLADIESALSACDGRMVHKQKRDIDRRIKRNYVALLTKLSNGPTFISVDPGTSPNRVIEACQVVISMPFTSTALIGAAHGKPSVFYDPLGILEKDDRAAHGIELLSGPEELRDWLRNQLVGQTPDIGKRTCDRLS